MVMLANDNSFVLSPSDLTRSADCEFGWLRTVDAKLGRLADPIAAQHDAMLERTSILGDAHERRHLDELKREFGTGLVEVQAPRPYTPSTLTDARDVTLQHLRDGVDVVFQAAFFDGGFGGMADFIKRGVEGRYEVWDTKLARHAKVSALLQIAAYADQLDRDGIPRSPIGYLLLGDGTPFAQDLSEIIPVYHERRRKLEMILAAHVAQPDAVTWNDPRFTFCGSCASCVDEIERGRDLLLVAGMRKTQRTKLRAAGIETIEQLAHGSDPIDGINTQRLHNLRLQAQLQIAPPMTVDSREVPPFEIVDAEVIRGLPDPSPGDVFFDFEGDPLWSDDAGTEWGLEYLFGVVEPADDGHGVFRPWWAHNRAEERQALIDFLAYLDERLSRHPDLHVYHYAPYEVTALKRLVGRYGVGEDFLDSLLRGGVFIDLYATVRHSLRAGTTSYSIKKLEPLYMGAELREGLDNAADSIVEYQRFTDARADGREAEATKILEGIADYNRYDCLSTWRLRDWLRDQIDGTSDPGEPAPPEPDDSSDEAAPHEDSIDALAEKLRPLLEFAGDPGERTHDQQAAAMVAAAVGYHRREHKPFWWSYFDRLASYPEEWPEPRDFVFASRVDLLEDWHVEGRKAEARILAFHGQLEPASNVRVGNGYKGIYDDISDSFEMSGPPAIRAFGGNAEITDISVDADGNEVIVVSERVPKGKASWTEMPIGLCVSSVISTATIEAVLVEVARSLASTLPGFPSTPGLDILRRMPPRLTGGALEAVGVDPIDAIYDSLMKLDRSYLAVQGPPGTGKTYVGSRVVANLVDAGWKVGVVAQSHAVVENFLNCVINDAGLDPAVIAKPNKSKDTSDQPWSVLSGDRLGAFIADHSGGCLVGGVAWTFCSRKVVDVEGLDLLVVDEAGQFSLANTLACSVAAKNLLLLGDPQQLPQVSQGTHPEPVDTSALGWIIEDQSTMPADRGYFLARSWRMHSELSAAVSRLSYAGELRSNVAVTDSREMSGVTPGVHMVSVDHTGNSVQSAEEAAVIVNLVRDLQSETWRASAEAEPRPMSPSDVLVVAPYNAQVTLLRRSLDEAGFSDVRVGTVDKFQGQEAPVVIVSMTASGVDDVPRGMEFLLNRNRLNVAISRGQWAAYVVRSSTLTDFLPNTPEGLAELGGFIDLAPETAVRL